MLLTLFRGMGQAEDTEEVDCHTDETDRANKGRHADKPSHRYTVHRDHARELRERAQNERQIYRGDDQLAMT